MLTVVLSHAVFSGFQRHVSLHQFDCMKNLCTYMQTQLVSYLQTENLTILVKDAQRLSLHCHDYDFYDDISKSSVDIIYLCCSSECSKKNDIGAKK
jgi:hypothetical protein